MTKELHETNPHPSTIVTICRDESIAEAARKMRSNGVGCLIVTDKCERLAGIITERDIVSSAVANPLDLEKSTVGEIMKKDVIWCSPDTEPYKARELMAANHIRHLPIVQDGKAVSIYSMRDVVTEQLTEDRMAAEQVAMLSACLKSTNLVEITNTVTHEVPRLFDAKRCVLYFQEDSSDATRRADDALSQQEATVPASYNDCICPRQCLKDLFKDEKCPEGFRLCTDSLPLICQKEGASRPRLVIQLKINEMTRASQSSKGTSPEGSGSLRGFLCMCGLETSKAFNQSLLHYKAKLLKDILNAHLTNVAQYQDARVALLTDTLTKVSSRRYFEDILDNECSRTDRYGRPFTVAIVDVDNFKKLNDTFGHVEGDSALKRLAECMKNQKRNSDTVARFGGDEFVVILPETRAQDAITMLERIQKKVREIKVGENFLVTVSCGVAQIMSGEIISGNELIRRADTALYKAKDDGRDCIRIWNENMQGTPGKGQSTHQESAEGGLQENLYSLQN
jgi:diguanylate cyclase (GGDEF)-like protein